MCPVGRSSGFVLPERLLKKPKILILDDSTSAVDTKTDASIRKAMQGIYSGNHENHHCPAHRLPWRTPTGLLSWTAEESTL